MTTIEAALYYAARGYAVFPICRETKRPLRGSHGFHDASTDEGQLRTWFEDTDHNIAMPLRRNGLIAVDVDPRNGGTATLAALEAKLGQLPRDQSARSAGNGEHILMADPGGRARGKLDYLGAGKGVDIKSRGYVLVEPSTNSSGGRYEWKQTELPKPGHAPLVPPAWLAVLLHPDADEDAPDDLDLADWDENSDPVFTPEDSNRLRTALANLGPRKGGNSTTFQATRLIFHDYGLGITDGWPYLIEWNNGNGSPHLQHELERKVMSIAVMDATGRRGRLRSSLTPFDRMARAAVPNPMPIMVTGQPSDAGAAPDPTRPTPPTLTDLECEAHELAQAAIPPEPGTWAHQLAIARSDISAALGTDTGNSAEAAPLFEHVGALLARKYPDEPYLVDRMVKRGGTLLVSGEPKTGKSWVLTEIALACATGRDAFGKFPTGKPLRVAYFYAEDLGADVQDHLKALAAGRGMPLAELTAAPLYIQPRGQFIDVLNPEDLARIVASCRQLGGVDLLCLEPLRDIHSGEENESDSMRDVMRGLRILGELLKCTIAAAHHAKKNADSGKGRGGQQIRGSGAIHGAIDSGLYLSSTGGDGRNILTAKVESQIKGAQSGGLFDLKLTIVDGSNGKSIKATWDVDRPEAGQTARADDEAGIADELMGRVVEAIHVTTLRADPVSRESIRRAVRGGAKDTKEAIAEAMRRGLIAKRMIGRKQCGWKLTAAGADFLKPHTVTTHMLGAAS